MLVAPLVFATIVSGIVSMGDVGKLGRLGARVLAFYLCTTAIAIVIGIVAAMLLPSFTDLPTQAEVQPPPATTAPSSADKWLEMIPTNPFEALATGNIFQIIVIAILLGAGSLTAGEAGKGFANFMSSFAEVMLSVTAMVMELAPFGVLALMAVAIGEYGLDAFGSLLALVFIFYIACAFHCLITYGGVLWILLGLDPRRFAEGVVDAQAVAFSTSSSSATLPATFGCVQENLGVGKSTASFVLPLGATINMDGTGIYLGITTMFAANLAGISLSLTDCLELVATASLASIGIAGVPGGSLVMLSTVLLALDLPLEVFALMAGIDRVLDMARTAVNVTGDALACVYVGIKSDDFEQAIYDTPALR